MEPDKLAAMDETDGELSHNGHPPVVGREAIETHLSALGATKVTAYELAATSTTSGSRWRDAEGHLAADARDDTETALGVFEAHWVHLPDGRWLLTRMHTDLATTKTGS